MFLEYLTEPQAVLLSGILTLVSGIFVAIAGPLLIGGQFSSVKEAAAEAKKVAESITENLKIIQTTVNQTRNDVADLETGCH